MSQILTWQASHDSLNMRENDLAVGKAYGTNGEGLIDIKNGIQLFKYLPIVFIPIRINNFNPKISHGIILDNAFF